MKNIKIMVVDDETDFIELFIKRFLKRQINVTGASSGQEALDKLEKDSFDVIVLDVFDAGNGRH